MITFPGFGKPSTSKHYKNLDALPIWNWYMLNKSGTLKYLLCDVDYDEANRISVGLYRKLKEQYKELLYQFESLDLSVLQARVNYQQELMKLVAKLAKGSTDAAKLDKAYTVVMALMATDEPNLDWIWKVDFTENTDQRQHLTEIARAITVYNNLKKRPTVEQTLNEKAVKIEMVLNVQIDIKTCSVLKFKEYEKQAIEKINIHNKILQ